MAQANGGAAGVNGDLPQADGAAVAAVEGAAVADGAVPQGIAAAQPQMDGAGVRAAGPLVAGPPIADVAGLLFPILARFDVDGVLVGPLPTKSNGSCKILPKIADETEP